MQLDQRRETFGNEDQSWLSTSHGTDSPRNATLAASTFTPATHYPNGYFPSGLALGKITAAGATLGCFGPYDPAATDGRQTFVGFLFTTQRAPIGTVTTATRINANILKHGGVIVNRLPIPSQIDTAARTAAAGRIVFE